MKRLAILGAGGHGKVVAEAAAAGDWGDIAFYDDNVPEGAEVCGWPVKGAIQDLTGAGLNGRKAVVAVGNCRTRLELCRKVIAFGSSLPVIVHPSASLSNSAKVGMGTVILAQAVVAAEASLGVGVIVNHGATVDHDCNLDDGVHICPGVNLAGNVRVGACTWIGIGSAVRDGVNIGCDVTVGAGAAVAGDVADGLVVVGVPAKEKTRNKS